MQQAQADLQLAQQSYAQQQKIALQKYQTRLRQLGANANANGTITIMAPIAKPQRGNPGKTQAKR